MNPELISIETEINPTVYEAVRSFCDLNEWTQDELVQCAIVEFLMRRQEVAHKPQFESFRNQLSAIS